MSCENFNGNIVLPKSTTGTNVEVRSNGTPVTTAQEGDKTVYYIGSNVNNKPTASLTVTPSFIEVGQTVTATFTGTYAKGTNDITSKVVSPTVVSVTNSPFTFEVVGVTSSVKGIVASHTFTVSDGVNSVVSSAGVTVKARYYMGFSSSASLSDITGFSSDLGSKIEDVYGGPKTYTVPANNYIYWLTVDDWTPNLTMNGLDFCVKKIETIAVTNQYGLAITYNVWRSVNSFGASNLIIDMK